METKARVQCGIADCGNPRSVKGLCFKHYRRWQRHGATELPPKATACSVQGCEEPPRSKSYCTRHYNRWLTSGRVDAVIRTEHCTEPGCTACIARSGRCEQHYHAWRLQAATAICVIDECDGAVASRGWCDLHYRRWMFHGSAEWQPPTTDSYNGIHLKTSRHRGRAADHLCIDCGLAADEWSYDHADPEELRDDRGCPYSLDPAHYDPRCRSCHRRLDKSRTK